MKKLIVIALIAVAMLSAVSSAYAHSGRTDSWGGHTVRTPGYGRTVGAYHFH
ncbi:MAG: YHYH domain-containing protein [Omnitrophica bacterium]|nr:YHYH domain-containing protein [Candidatus Omnitrophota bacterium]